MDNLKLALAFVAFAFGVYLLMNLPKTTIEESVSVSCSVTPTFLKSQYNCD